MAAAVCSQLSRRRPRLLRPPRPWARDRAGRDPRPRDGGAHGPRYGPLPRARRLDAPRRRRARLHGRDRRRRRERPDRARERAGRAPARSRLTSRSSSSATARCRPATSTRPSTSPTLWRLPLILVCENNGFAEFTPRSAHTRRRARRRRRRAVRPRPADGRRKRRRGDVGRRSAASSQSARAGGGPFLLECLTHRLRGHYEGDPAQYREALADAEWQEKDPIVRLERARRRRGLVRRGRGARDRGGCGRGGRGGGALRP